MILIYYSISVGIAAFVLGVVTRAAKVALNSVEEVLYPLFWPHLIALGIGYLAGDFIGKWRHRHDR